MRSTRHAAGPMTSAPTPIPSRTQYVLEAIKHAILTGRLSPGQALVETDLAAQFGVSKTPVREALKTLAGTGLVVMSQYKGVTVRTVDAAMAREVYDVRLLLEPEALRRTVTAGRVAGGGPGGAGAGGRGRRPGRPVAWPTGTSTARCTCRAATRCWPGCSTRCATRPPWSRPSPGPPAPSWEREAREHREILRLAPGRRRRRRRPALLHDHIASFVHRAFPETPTTDAATERKVTTEQRRVSDSSADGRTRRRRGDPGDPVRRRRRRRPGRLPRPAAPAARRRHHAPSPRTATPASSTPSTPEERRLVTELTVDEAGGPGAPSWSASVTTCRPRSPPPGTPARPGAQMVMVHQPVHPYVSQDGWVDYHRAIAEAVPELGVVPYIRNPLLDGERARRARRALPERDRREVRRARTPRASPPSRGTRAWTGSSGSRAWPSCTRPPTSPSAPPASPPGWSTSPRRSRWTCCGRCAPATTRRR